MLFKHKFNSSIIFLLKYGDPTKYFLYPNLKIIRSEPFNAFNIWLWLSTYFRQTTNFRWTVRRWKKRATNCLAMNCPATNCPHYELSCNELSLLWTVLQWTVLATNCPSYEKSCNELSGLELSALNCPATKSPRTVAYIGQKSTANHTLWDQRNPNVLASDWSWCVMSTSELGPSYFVLVQIPAHKHYDQSEARKLGFLWSHTVWLAIDFWPT